jgi:hypothetical protein
MVTKLLALVTLFAGVAIGITALPTAGFSAEPQIAQTADDVVLRNVKISPDGEVTGEVLNNSEQVLRDIELEILYSWQWKNEFRPGKDDPGRAVYVTDRPRDTPARARRLIISLRRPFLSEKTVSSILALKLSASRGSTVKALGERM